ncbi:hypothetical protein [Natrinema halophilum]|nr:hypothetical protein [Natrinema halophilum]
MIWLSESAFVLLVGAAVTVVLGGRASDAGSFGSGDRDPTGFVRP